MFSMVFLWFFCVFYMVKTNQGPQNQRVLDGFGRFFPLQPNDFFGKVSMVHLLL